MQNGQYLVATVETKDERKERLLRKYPSPISYPYYSLDFLLKRVFPKLKPTRKIYFAITGGKNRVISLTEALGRLVSCGFEIVGHKKINNLTYIISKKIKKPFYDMQPTFGAIIKLKRIGYQGKIFDVYKVRTMYPYSEYLQEYVYQINNLEEGGKFQDDFRTTSYGHFFRRFWIDELPMIYNWLRREMKLVGVRPLSEHYFYLYPQEIQEMRIKSKPGLVPPYYADLPKGLDEILESEKKYLESYNANPIKTDLIYFFKAFKNILFTGARSR
ncbi:MAG: sugar transferase [Balneolaceae bacterium]|nr:sugar transferase [Balneolaceae bacterium]